MYFCWLQTCMCTMLHCRHPPSKHSVLVSFPTVRCFWPNPSTYLRSQDWVCTQDMPGPHSCYWRSQKLPVTHTKAWSNESLALSQFIKTFFCCLIFVIWCKHGCTDEAKCRTLTLVLYTAFFVKCNLASISRSCTRSQILILSNHG